MTTTPSRPSAAHDTRGPRPARATGYVVAAGINLALILLVNVTPGWRWVPVLTEAFSGVVGLVTLSLVVAAAFNLLYLLADPPWLKRLGDAATATVAVLVMLALWRVFPFDLAVLPAGWATPLEILLIVGVVGAAIAALVSLALCARDLAAAAERW